MTAPRVFIAVLSAAILIPDAASAQIFDRLKKKLGEARDAVADARSIRCGVQGVCGTVSQSDMFDPRMYESLAVTVFDGTARFSDAGAQGIVRDAFESMLVERGYLLAANADAAQARTRMARGDAWTDEDLAQLKDFIHGIDAVLLVDVRRIDTGRCAIDGQANRGTEATVHMSARWVHVDVGDVPWVATHSATICDEGAAAHTTALETASAQLATTLPDRREAQK